LIHISKTSSGCIPAIDSKCYQQLSLNDRVFNQNLENKALINFNQANKIPIPALNKSTDPKLKPEQTRKYQLEIELILK
jgi:hypothetical protein